MKILDWLIILNSLGLHKLTRTFTREFSRIYEYPSFISIFWLISVCARLFPLFLCLQWTRNTRQLCKPIASALARKAFRCNLSNVFDGRLPFSVRLWSSDSWRITDPRQICWNIQDNSPTDRASEWLMSRQSLVFSGTSQSSDRIASRGYWRWRRFWIFQELEWISRWQRRCWELWLTSNQSRLTSYLAI
jgi:hypothetical protein